MRFRPFHRLSALAGALVLGTVGLGMTSAVAAPAPVTPPALPAPAGPDAPDAPEVGEAGSELVPVIVLLDDQPRSLSLDAEATRLRAQQGLVEEWSVEYGLEVDRQFGYLVNGFSALLPEHRIADLALEPGVASVRRERVYERTEHTARENHGVPAAWAGHGVDGTGMVISIIDSGLDPSHPDMRLDDCGAAAIQEIHDAPAAGFTCKIPAGYNYADESYVIKDVDANSHGQHVGGIAAANGSDGPEPGDFAETGRIDGAAPNAQLLAMKVFSNSGGGAADSDVVAAIEDSVKLDADVINMSLGSQNGLKSTSDASSLAIEAARDAGVITVIAAGNDGQNFSTGGIADDALGLHDDGTVGSPGTQGSALTVASLDNSVVTQLMAYVDEETEGIPYSPATGIHDGQPHELVDLGLATAEEVAGQQLDGAYALVQRGEITFTEKYENAIAAGAGGIVVFNSADGGDAAFGMAGVENSTLPGITLGHSAGAELAARVAEGPTTLRITEEVAVLPSASALTPSEFTSWGSTPSLDFEPEIAGIGGDVYSTVNDGAYGLNSGTSMASPNVAGLSALVLQHLEQTAPEVTGAERVDLAKVLLMNTATVPVGEDGIPASPRQVGAGLARVDLALDSTVTATVDGDGAAALREVSGATTFTITLKNFGGTAASFTVPAGQDVLAETNEPGAPTEVRVSGGTLTTSATEVSVPAGGTASIDVTVTPEAGEDHFTGGWVQLVSADPAQSDLAVPYLGFAGDWNAEPIVREAGAELIPGTGVRTELLTSWGGQTLPLVSEVGEFWLSPNGDGDMDVISPNLVLMRNAAELRYEVLDASGTVITTVGEEQSAYRRIVGDYLAAPDPRALQWTGPGFDGLVYDPQGVEFSALPDGQYTYRVGARLTEDSPWQSTDLDFGIDATAPVIEFGAYEAGLLTFTVTEEGSGLLAAPTATGAGGEDIEVAEAPDGSYAIEIDPAATPFVTVSVLDAGFNLGVGTEVFAPTSLVIPDADQLAAQPLGPQSALVAEGQLVLRGYVSSDIAAVRAGEQVSETDNGRFTLALPLAEGPQEFLVEALDTDGAVLTSQQVPVTFDATPPELTITEMETDAEGAAVLAEDGTLHIAGIVSDEREGADLTVRSGETIAEVAADGSFALTLAPGDDVPAVTLVASDGANTATTAVAISGRAAAPAWQLPQFTNADCVLEQGACFVPGSTADISADGSVFTLRGQLPGGGTLTLTPESRVGEDGEYVDAAEITAEIAADGTFSADLPVATGENHFRMLITDAQGQTRFDRGVRFYVDVNAPSLQIEEPTLVGGTLYTATEEVTLAGTAEDDGWGYTFALNGSVVIERFDASSPGQQSNRRDFSTTVRVADGDTLLVEFVDGNGNALLGLVPVVLDTVAPTVSVDPLAEGERVTDARELTVTAEDENLATLQVLVDGEIVHDSATELTTQEHAVEDALIDVRELAAAADGVTASGALTTAAQGVLSASVPTAELAPGAHDLTVISTDLAGNTTTEAIAFTVEHVLAIEGPEAVDLEIHRELLGDQTALAEQALAPLSATLGGEAAEGATLSLAPGTVLTEGEQTVTVLAVDGEGRTAERELTVTISLALVTLTDGEVTATATFRSDDALSATLTAADGHRELTLSNRAEFASLPAVITVPGAEGETVVRILADGRAVPVPAQLTDGILTFEGPSQAVYRIQAAPAAGDGDEDGTDGGTGGGGGTGDGSGDGRGDGAGSGSGSGDGSGDRSGTGGSQGPLARTGTEVLAPLALGVVLLLGGGSLLILRRRG